MPVNKVILSKRPEGIVVNEVHPWKQPSRVVIFPHPLSKYPEGTSVIPVQSLKASSRLVSPLMPFIGVSNAETLAGKVENWNLVQVPQIDNV